MMDRSSTEPHKTSGNEPHQTGTAEEPHNSVPPGKGPREAALLATALNLTSMAVLEGHFESARRAFRPGPPLWRRDAWVRSTLAQQALLARLRVAPDATVMLRPENGGSETPLLTLTRPEESLQDSMVEAVIRLKDDRTDRLPEILIQATDLWPFWTLVTGIQPERAPRTAELMDVAAQLSPWIGQPLKHLLNIDRPSERSARVQPLIAVPGHASYPSGHATGAWLFATVMPALLGLADNDPVVRMLHSMAGRISHNREVAGLHDELDSAAGRELGVTLGQFFVACCQGGKVPTKLLWDPNRSIDPLGRNGSAVQVRPLELLGQLWQASRQELGANASALTTS